MPRIESLLSSRLFLTPQIVGQRLFFISNLSGQLSLYAMDYGGSVPEPLLPPNIALQNPELIGGHPFCVYPDLGQILVMIDRDGDENYQPMRIPIDGGIPEPAFGDSFANDRVFLAHADPQRNLAYLTAEERGAQRQRAYRCDVAARAVAPLGESKWGCWIGGVSDDHTRAILVEAYTSGDHVLFMSERGERRLLYGTPLDARAPGQEVQPNGITAGVFTAEGGLLLITALFDDAYGLGYLDLADPQEVRPVAVAGTAHAGGGELVGLEHLHGDRYLVSYNIDGCSWAYEGSFDQGALHMRLDTVVCGTGALAGGVQEGLFYDRAGDRYALAFSTATSPTQLYTVEGRDRAALVRHTRERLLGLPAALLAPGEDASFSSFDGLRVSARLYMPAPALGFSGPRPVVFYIHGGPQGQERPNFAWFSMPLIQLLTLSGFAVFVPNARGSTGYGMRYMKKVDHDWGGDDRLDHVHALGLLARDPRIDAARAGVVGRSYGGYMTLTLAARHPELWSAAVDMFGPYDLLTFIDRVPEAWKPYFAISVGDPVRERDLLVERSPRTYIEQIACPMLVIQGQNDPRVIERESRDVVDQLRVAGKQVDYLLFENEGHDVLKYENRVACYSAIAEFFSRHLRP